jgi:hypothetical protein
LLSFKGLREHDWALVASDVNGSMHDVFVRDLVFGTTTLVSRSDAGIQGNGTSAYSAISEDGRFFGYWSLSNNLVAGDANGKSDLFLVTNCFVLYAPGAPGIAGAGGFVPKLAGVAGACVPGGSRIEVSDGLGAAPALLFAGLAALPGSAPGFHVDLSAPALAVPLLLHGTKGVPGAGKAAISSVGLERYPGLELTLQVAVADRFAPHGIAFSNALALAIDP